MALTPSLDGILSRAEVVLRIRWSAIFIRNDIVLVRTMDFDYASRCLISFNANGGNGNDCINHGSVGSTITMPKSDRFDSPGFQLTKWSTTPNVIRN